VNVGPLTPEFTTVEIATFFDDVKKSAHFREYLRKHGTDLRQIFRFDRNMCGHDETDIRFAVAKGTLLRQPINFRGFLQTSKLSAFIVCSVIPKGTKYHYRNARINSGDNVATWCKNLVNFGPVSLQLKTVECGIFFCCDWVTINDRPFGTLAFRKILVCQLKNINNGGGCNAVVGCHIACARMLACIDRRVQSIARCLIAMKLCHDVCA